jgi:hypothetical protein
MDIPRDIHKMETASDCVVVYAERVGGDVIIEFNDGKCALYSASFLHSMLTEATEMDASDYEED